MDTAREDRLEGLFEEARSLPLAQRAAFLADACSTDAELKDTLGALVARAQAAHDFVDQVAGPTVARAAAALLGDRASEVGRDADALVGRCFAHFQILEKLGGGGMGRVYKALDVRLGRTVALKILPPHRSADEEAKQRFVYEARAASALDHASIGTVHEIGATDTGELFIAMAFYDGQTLRRKIARGPLTVSEALDHAVQIAEGLQRAHDTGIVHRDVKPANVMITAQGQVKIVDFGLAKMAGSDLTREGTTLGTVAYMSPEQTRAGSVDARSDLWSFGVVLYEMLAGQRPFGCESDEAVIHAIRHDEATPIRQLRADLPASLAVVIGRCLEKDPARRYQRADELLVDLRIVREGGPVRQPGLRARILRRGALAAFAGLLLVLGGTRTMHPEPKLESLAVLPATTVASGARQIDFAEGMTDLLISDLSRLSGLRRVVSGRSTAQYAATRKSSREIGRELGVNVLVEMSVLTDGEQLRIGVSLIAAEAERVLWSRSFERPLRDVLTLQREVAQAIASELAVRVTPQETARMTRAAREVNPEALALYLQAARAGDPRRQMTYLEQAILRDSTFALAYAKLAIAYVMLARDGVRAERAVATALALEPTLSDGYDALGLLRMWVDRDWRAAETAFRRALELNPHNGLAHHELGQLHMRLGRCDDAVVEEGRAVLQHPGVVHYQNGLAEIHLYCRRYDDAVREFRKALELVRDSAGTYVSLGDAYFHQRQYGAALAMYEQSRRPLPGWVLIALGRTREARSQVDSLQAQWARGEGNAFTAWNLARIYTTLGERERAITWLERGHEAGHGLVIYLGVHPHFDALRGEPRFRSLLRRVHLAD